MPAITLEQAQAAKRAFLERYSSRAEVVGVGITRTGDGDYAVKVNLSHRPDTGEELPANVDGVPVVSEVVGHIRAR